MNHNRFNIYTCIHKGLRAQMTQLLAQLGQIDESDSDEVMELMNCLTRSLNFFKAHLKHENQFIHPVLTRLNGGNPPGTEQEHVHHELVIADLLKDVEVIKLLPMQLRLVPLQNLYRNYAIFVAENLEHMHIEETENSALLWQHLSDDEIIAIEQAIVGSLSPEVGMESLIIMLPNLSVGERHAMLKQFRQDAGEEAYAYLLAQIIPLLSEKALNKLGQLNSADQQKISAVAS
jgi:hypothetical protein